MKLRSALPLLFMMSAAPAFAAAPAGTFVFKMKNPQADGTITLRVSGGNVRSDMDMNAKGMGPMKMSMLVKGTDAKKGYLLNEPQKTYAEVDVGKKGETKSKGYKAKKIGVETVGKWKATHVELTDDSGEKADIWTTTEIDLGRSLFELLGNKGPGDDGMMKALESVGAAGFPVKMVSAKNDGVSLELVSHDAKAPPAALFEIPGDWKKQNPGAVMGASLPPEAQKKMEEALRNMTPEQREQFEKAMRARQAQ